MSDATKIQELENQLQRQRERFHSIEDIARALASTLDRDHLLARIMAGVTELMEAERSTLFLADHEQRELWSKIAQEAGVEEIRVRFGEGIAGHVALSGEQVNIPDAYADPRFQSSWDQKTGFRTRSILCRPIFDSQGVLLGVVQVLNKFTGAFGPEDETLLAALGAQAAISLENSRLYQAALSQHEELVATHSQLERRTFELEFLLEVERDLSTTHQEEAVMESVITRTCQVMGAESGSVLLAAPDGGDLYFKYATGEHTEALKRFRLPVGRGIAGWVSAHGMPIITNDPSGDPRHHWPIAEALTFPAHNILCVPLRGDQGVFGALEVINKEGDFTDEDTKLLTLVAGLVAKALQQVRSREEQRRASRLADLGQMLSGILHDLRTPMTVISGYTQLMAREKEPAERERYSEAVLKHVDQLGAMARDILAFARGESELLVRNTQMFRFCEELRLSLEPELEDHQIRLEVEMRYRGVARFDQAKLRRVIFNLARNAIEAMPEGGSFTMIVDRDEENLVLTFRDSGPGVPSELRQSIFDSFVSGGKHGGTGLGLAIARKFLADHQGDIRLTSEPGEGATFVCRLPLDPQIPSPPGDA